MHHLVPTHVNSTNSFVCKNLDTAGDRMNEESLTSKSILMIRYKAWASLLVRQYDKKIDYWCWSIYVQLYIIRHLLKQMDQLDIEFQ